MMLNTLAMTDAQEHDARDKAFYLLKKWTSLTFLEQAVRLYRDFLGAYAQQLNSPSPNQEELEEAYTHDFLGALVQMDQGIDVLRQGLDKRSAYDVLIIGSERGGDLLFGRSAAEIGRKYDPFFHALGLKNNNFRDPDYATGFVEGVWIERLMCYALNCSIGFGFEGLLAYGTRTDGGTRVFEHWTYESLFQDAPLPAWRYWPPGRNYPVDLPSCPSKNKSRDGEIESGQEIPVEGIWEPWFPAGKVGCPNYFLKGSIAHKYMLEGTNDEHVVQWRLLWEDRRYQDGSIPEEEATYFPQAVMQQNLRALPGETCQRTGHWQKPGHEGFGVRRSWRADARPSTHLMGYGHLALCRSPTGSLSRFAQDWGNRLEGDHEATPALVTIFMTIHHSNW
ncbi:MULTISPECIES: Imm72 family immunity protein [Burkholderia]|nr:MULTISPECIES: Imm72 family immunity protein [Burkholderia]MDN7724397.1 Imm72 family immunity protein [Burkholderia gladioli]MDN7739823.1 Imm72 family immunity protein [Burkholderia gladioli]TWC66073.1 immunity protein 72 of polymorphic toxin system [Burkholderia sp. SJZ089]TWC98617.1 immunity protein 72 of polymorphic toxin system [Burkholderia sp. SJZ115]TWD01978.1 immunity protein 72 of polymorphic toxin system [Burkholderia sp. SJZ091]